MKFHSILAFILLLSVFGFLFNSCILAISVCLDMYFPFEEQLFSVIKMKFNCDY